jgi:NDP-sugar pyrophosphorylase family protein
MLSEQNFNIPQGSETSSEAVKEREKQELIKQTTVYINAGGRGTRLESILPKGPNGITKAMIELNEQPIIQHHVDLLLALGFKNVIVGAGDHLNVKEHFQGQENERLSVINTELQKDTAGDLIEAIQATENLGTNILVENVDTLLFVKDLGELLKQHQDTGAAGTIVLTTRPNVPNENAFFVDENHRVVFSREDRQQRMAEPKDWQGFKGSSTGTVVLNADMLKSFAWQSSDGPLSLYRDLIPQLIEAGKLYAYDNEKNLFMDIGTPDNYRSAKRHEQLLGALPNKYLNKK